MPGIDTELTVEQQFTLAQANLCCATCMSQEEWKELANNLLRQIMIKDNMIKLLIDSN